MEETKFLTSPKLFLSFCSQYEQTWVCHSEVTASFSNLDVGSFDVIKM